MERQWSREFMELICDRGIMTGVLIGVISRPAAVAFCGVCFHNMGQFKTWLAMRLCLKKGLIAYQLSLVKLQMREM